MKRLSILFLCILPLTSLAEESTKTRTSLMEKCPVEDGAEFVQKSTQYIENSGFSCKEAIHLARLCAVEGRKDHWAILLSAGQYVCQSKENLGQYTNSLYKPSEVNDIYGKVLGQWENKCDARFEKDKSESGLFKRMSCYLEGIIFLSKLLDVY